MARNIIENEKFKKSKFVYENNQKLFLWWSFDNDNVILSNCVNDKNNEKSIIDKTSSKLEINNDYVVSGATGLFGCLNSSESKNCATKKQCAIHRMLRKSCNYYPQSWRFTRLVILLLITLITSVDSQNVLRRRQSSVKDNFYSHPRDEFSSHTIIQPKVHHGQHKRAITSTLEEDGLHAQHITLSFHHRGQNLIADLQLNEHLIPHGHFLRYQHHNGEQIVQNLTKTEVDLCHYQGTIRGNPNTKVAISTCNGINGVVFDGSDTYFIYSGREGRLHDDHYLFRHDDMILNATCGYSDKGSNKGNDDSLENLKTFNHIPDLKKDFNRIHRYKRSTDDNTIRGPYNANKHSSFVELVIVVDNKVYKTFGENMKKVHNHCKDIANIVNALYVPLNIFIALVGVVVWNESNEIELSSDGDITLKNFLHYRRKVLAQDHPNDNAQLLTKEQFNGGVVGKALKGPMCTYEYSGGVSMEHSQIVGVVATTVAHEMGHNFGMEHDTSDCKCKEEKCIMSASSTSIVPRYWSSCSVDQLNVAFSRGMNYCLRNKPTKLFDSPQCGNGFVEPGEQCDCGLPKFCENTCCDPNTCMLYANASCATGECCDLKTCRPKTAGTECRSAEGECDLSEYCTGESEYCPADVYKRDTETCDGGNAFCYQGSCRSRSNQCKILWGPSGESSENCYKKNTDGSRHGNCGYDRITQHYSKCENEDIFCGMLHCRHLNERLEFGMESAAVLSHSFMSHGGSIIPCRTAIVDLGLQSIDPGLAPNGAKCGEGKMCVNQKCVQVEKLRAEGQGVECPENCNGQGVCNSKGHCHCFVGFGPPYCSIPGTGGSEDSGPATNPNSRVGFTRAMYIFFLGVVPTVSLFLFFTYYWKQNRPLATRKSTTVLKTTLKSAPSRGSSSPPGGMPTSSPSSTDDMNSALLRSPTESDTSLLNNSMFGKFKGFTLKPLPNAAGATNIGAPNVAFVHPVTKPPIENYSSMGVPARAAPPPPKPPSISPEMTQFADIKPSLKQNGTLPNAKISSPTNTLNNQTSAAPALPPPNPGFSARPIISSPILEASTCTAKELLSPLKNSNNSIPVRPAPVAPSVAPPVPPHADPKFNQVVSSEKGFKDGTIRRIASFLKKEDNSSQRHPQKVKAVIDREKLKNIEISAPIPVVDSTYDSERLEDRQSVVRTQSMRDTSSVVKKPNIQSFGSMRQSSKANRPKSMVGSRPKSPPPRPPAPPIVTNLKIPGLPGYQNPPEIKKSISKAKQSNEYDDCEAVEAPLAHISEENSPTGSDEIYSVIDERPPQHTLELPVQNLSGSNDSMGLLGEIVNEIEKRNVDSIYSASTLKKKKSLDNGNTYANTSESNDDGDYVKSNGSTTSSGYLRPSSINTPVARIAPTRPDQPLTTVVGTSSGTGSSSNSFSSFKPKTPVQSANINGVKNVNKPALASKMTSSVLNRGKTTPQTTSNKPTSDSIRKRSPSPVGLHQKSSLTNRNRPTTSGNTPGVVRKNSVNESKNTDTSPVSAVKKTLKSSETITTTGNQSQKPKPLSKPTSIGSKPPITGTSTNPSNLELKLGRQNSLASPSGSDTSTKPILALNKRSKSTDQPMTNRKTSLTNSKIDDNLASSSVNHNSLSNNSSSSKMLNAAARPAPGKISNVASLQQRFENVVSATSSSSSSAPSGMKSSGGSSLVANTSSTTNSMTGKK